MKILFIWDIHWRTEWKYFVKQVDYDKVVFMWDYFDSFDVSIEDQLSNFNEILNFQEKSKKEVILLIWNHDYHYLEDIKETYSWFSPELKIMIWNQLSQFIKRHNKEVMQLCWSYEWLLATHAWLSNGFVNRVKEKYNDKFVIDGNNLNELLKQDTTILWYYKWDISGFWNHQKQWPLRIRPDALIDDYCKSYDYQVVWHTHMKGVTHQPIWKWVIVFIDTIPKHALLAEYKDWRKFKTCSWNQEKNSYN